MWRFTDRHQLQKLQLWGFVQSGYGVAFITIFDWFWIDRLDSLEH